MKIIARINFTEDANREFIVQTFFGKEFSHENSIKIKNDEKAEIELVFEDSPPQEIIRAISHCKIESLEYSKKQSESLNQDNYDAANDSTIEAIGTVSACENKKTEVEGSTDNPDKATEPKRKKRRGNFKPSEDDYLDIPQLDEFAKESENFEDFVMKVAKWIETEPDIEKYFCALLVELKKLEQEPYELRMIQIEDITKKVTRKPSEKTKLSRHLTDFLAEKKIDGGTFTPFIITVLKYKDSFSSEAKSEDVAEDENEVTTSKEEPDSTQSDTTEKKDEVTETSNKPEENNNLISNPAFAEIFSKVDRTLPTSEQISFLYSEMGFDASKSLFQALCRLTMTALSTEHLESIDNVMLEAGIDASTAAGMKVKVKISDMINDYNKTNHIKRMKVIAFLREIKSIFSLE